MTITLSPDIELSILAAVQSGRFHSVDEAVTAAWLELSKKQAAIQPQAEDAAAPPPTYKPIWEVAAELRKSVPAEEWEKLPVDGASQHDHYIYGTPKRPTQ